MIIDNIGKSGIKPRSGDINLSCLRHYYSFILAKANIAYFIFNGINTVAIHKRLRLKQ
jgi:site-specific recombinase XerC